MRRRRGALAQSYSASGQVGYLQEWEIKGSLAKTMTVTGADYSGPVTLRHVGLCSVNGLEEKSGVVRLTVSAVAARGERWRWTMTAAGSSRPHRASLFGPPELPRRPGRADPFFDWGYRSGGGLWPEKKKKNLVLTPLSCLG